MSAEQKIRASDVTGVADRMAEIQLGVALKQMKDAYERSEVGFLRICRWTLFNRDRATQSVSRTSKTFGSWPRYMRVKESLLNF